MSHVPDARPQEQASFDEAQDACDRLQAEIDRARQVLRAYRAAMGDAASANDNRQR